MVDDSRKIVSVITINLNDKEGLQRTISSVKAQNNPRAEHIVIDGGSTDGSGDVIKNNNSRFSYWISEPDKGVYDAQNKGILKANGDYLIFLNSGDTFYSTNVISEFIDLASKNSSKIIYGNSNIIKDNGAEEVLIPTASSLNFWYRNTLNHQAVFFHRSVFENYGPYDLSYKFSSDLDMLLKVYKKEPGTFFHFDKVICNYHEVGLSAQPENYETVISEKEHILKKHLTPQEYNEAKAFYLEELPFRTRMRVYISTKPWLKSLVSKFYPR